MRSSDDLIAFGTTDGVVLYRHGASTRMGTYYFDDPDAAVLDGGLAFGGAHASTPSPTTASSPRTTRCR